MGGANGKLLNMNIMLQTESMRDLYEKFPLDDAVCGNGKKDTSIVMAGC